MWLEVLIVMVLKKLGMASVSIQAGLEEFLDLEPISSTRFLSWEDSDSTYYLHNCCSTTSLEFSETLGSTSSLGKRQK